jgi:predicted nuclease with TOPRIM domain
MAEALKGITAELYEALIAVVDERVKEIRVTREDFSELKGIVGELAQSHNELRGAVTELAQSHNELRGAVTELAQSHNELRGAVTELAQSHNELRGAVTELAQSHNELRGAVTELAQGHKQLAQSHNELRGAVTELAQGHKQLAQSHNELRGAVKELAQAQARTEKAVANLAHQVGRMSDTIGYGLEDLGEWVLPAYFERAYGITGVERCIRRFIQVDRKEVEINLYAEGKRNGEAIVLLGESKNRIGRTEVKKFVAHLRVLERVLDKPAFRFLFGFWAHPSAERLARENNIEVISSYQLTR